MPDACMIMHELLCRQVASCMQCNIMHETCMNMQGFFPWVGTVNSYDTWHGMVPIRFQCGAVMIMWQRDAQDLCWTSSCMLGIGCGSLNFPTRICSVWKVTDCAHLGTNEMEMQRYRNSHGAHRMCVCACVYTCI